MKLNEGISLLLKIALPVLLGLLWAYRQHLRQRPARPKREEVPRERAYKAIEPTYDSPDYVRAASNAILEFHEWVKLAVLTICVVAGLLTVDDPIVRAILGATAAVLAITVIIWAYHRRRRRMEREVVDGVPEQKRSSRSAI